MMAYLKQDTSTIRRNSIIRIVPLIYVKGPFSGISNVQNVKICEVIVSEQNGGIFQ